MLGLNNLSHVGRGGDGWRLEQFRIRLSAPNQVEVEAEHGKNKGPTGPKRRGSCLCCSITGYANDLLDLYS